MKIISSNLCCWELSKRVPDDPKFSNKYRNIICLPLCCKILHLFWFWRLRNLFHSMMKELLYVILLTLEIWRFCCKKISFIEQLQENYNKSKKRNQSFWLWSQQALVGEWVESSNVKFVVHQHSVIEECSIRHRIKWEVAQTITTLSHWRLFSIYCLQPKLTWVLINVELSTFYMQ